MFAFILVGLYGFMSKWIDFDKHEKERAFVGTKKFPLTSLVLDSWDWDYNSRTDKLNWREGLHRDVNEKLNSDKILEELEKRTCAKKSIIYSVRTLSFLVNLSEIAVAFKTIIWTHNQQTEIASFLEGVYAGLGEVAPFAQALIISGINILIPTLTKAHVLIENWDF